MSTPGRRSDEVDVDDVSHSWNVEIGVGDDESLTESLRSNGDERISRRERFSTAVEGLLQFACSARKFTGFLDDCYPLEARE